MKLFVDKVSSYEGVETPNVQTEEKGVDDEIQFDPKSFMESIHNLLSEKFNVLFAHFCAFFSNPFKCQPNIVLLLNTKARFWILKKLGLRRVIRIVGT